MRTHTHYINLSSQMNKFHVKSFKVKHVHSKIAYTSILNVLKLQIFILIISTKKKEKEKEEKRNEEKKKNMFTFDRLLAHKAFSPNLEGTQVSRSFNCEFIVDIVRPSQLSKIIIDFMKSHTDVWAKNMFR